MAFATAAFATPDNRPSVIVVGSVNVDFVVRVPKLPGPGETVIGGSFERRGGGKGANQAVAAARAGASVRLIAAVGDDDLGRWQLHQLAAEGIDISGVVRLEGAATGVALITVDSVTGENQIAVASGANAQLDPDAVERALESVQPGPGAVCVLGFEIPDEVLLTVGSWVGRHGMRTIVNPAPARPIRPEVLALHPILTPNTAEAMALTGEPNPERAGQVLHKLSLAPALVTLGDEGALVADDSGVRRLPAFSVTAVDTTGAGDVFNGALAAALASGLLLDYALRRAMAAAALSTTHAGARCAPSAAEVETFLADQQAS